MCSLNFKTENQYFQFYFTSTREETSSICGQIRLLKKTRKERNKGTSIPLLVSRLWAF